MGKDLKGKELGKNITQEKNGYYMARYVDKWGKRQAKRFIKLQDCRRWIADRMYDNRHSDIRNLPTITVDHWYEQWISIRQKTVKQGSVINYNRVYHNHIQPILGNMLLCEVKSFHCQLVLNTMGEKGYKNSTIKNVKEVMFNIFNYAYDNDAIPSNPCKKSVKSNVGKESEPREVMTRTTQKEFYEHIDASKYGDHYRFILQTGLRVGELSGLKWQDIDFSNRIIRVTHNLEYYAEAGGWIEGTPKTQAGIRTIPLTDEAMMILKKQKDMSIISFQWKDNVFLDAEGRPIRDAAYNYDLTTICKAAKIPNISMHILRHTFATRCIEAGMKPKTLQKLLGHASIAITMNLYVHTTEDEKRREIDMVADSLSLAL